MEDFDDGTFTMIWTERDDAASASIDRRRTTPNPTIAPQSPAG